MKDSPHRSISLIERDYTNIAKQLASPGGRILSAYDATAIGGR
jgi:hypothetical protein